MLTNAEGTLMGAFLECMFYGAYVITMTDALQCLVRSSDSGRWKFPTGIRLTSLVVSLALFVNCSSNLAFGLIAMVQQHIFNEINKPRHWINIARPFNVAVQNILADVFLIYRCWVIYGRSWIVIIIPVMFWVCGTTLTMYILIVRTQGLLEVVGIPNKNLPSFLSSQCAMTLAINLYSTGFIVYRIYMTDKISQANEVKYLDSTSSSKHHTQSPPHQRTQLQRVMRIFTESALAYTIISIADFACVLSKSNGAFITSAIEIVTVGITFNLIIIRIAKERARERSYSKANAAYCDSRGITTLKFAPSASYQTVTGNGSPNKCLSRTASAARTGGDNGNYEDKDVEIV